MWLVANHTIMCMHYSSWDNDKNDIMVRSIELVVSALVEHPMKTILQGIFIQINSHVVVVGISSTR